MNTFAIEVADETAVTRPDHGKKFAWQYRVVHEESGDTFTGARTKALAWIKSRGNLRNTTPKPVEPGGLCEQGTTNTMAAILKALES